MSMQHYKPDQAVLADSWDVVLSRVLAENENHYGGTRPRYCARPDFHLAAAVGKYPPAEPGTLVLEPLEAAYPCCTSQASHPLCGMPHASPTAEPLQPAVPAICAPLGVA
jgi:hypothetical protein